MRIGRAFVVALLLTAASVLAQNGPATPPIDRVAQVCVSGDAADVNCTRTEAPLTSVPEAVANAAPSMLKLPPVTLIGAAASIPVTVIAFEVTAVLTATPVCAVNVNASGVVSATGADPSRNA